MKKLLIAVAVTATLAACSTTSPDVIQKGDAQRMSQVQDATVLSIRPVVVEGNQSGIGGTPWQYRDRYVENSPFFYLDRIETPLLLTHGTADTSVPSYTADQVFVGLRRLGKEVEYAKYEGEGHGEKDWSYENQIDYINRVVRWLDDHLKKSGRISQE